MKRLKIDSVTLRNVRCFDGLKVDFHPQLTVLVAENGGGKTTVLDAVAIALSPIVVGTGYGKGKLLTPDAIRLSRTSSSNTMELHPDGAEVEAAGYVPKAKVMTDKDPNQVEWRISLASKPRAKSSSKYARYLTSYGEAIREDVQRSGAQGIDSGNVFPVIAYFGTGRLWNLKKLTQKKLEVTSRLAAYSNALDSASNYKLFSQWFRYWSIGALEEKKERDSFKGSQQSSDFDAFIEAVSTAMDACLTPSGWGRLRYSLRLEELTAQHSEHGELPVSSLSDGIRTMIGLVGDIAFRATKLNPNLGVLAVKQAHGVVLIDEVDMHLHPSWQQLVLQGLCAAFPGIQFIVSTHSAQVLSTVARENIRLLGKDQEGRATAAMPLATTYGQPSGDLLFSVMSVNPQPPIDEKPRLDRLTELVDQGQFDTQEAKDLFAGLTQALGVNHPQLLRLQRSKARQVALQA